MATVGLGASFPSPGVVCADSLWNFEHKLMLTSTFAFPTVVGQNFCCEKSQKCNIFPEGGAAVKFLFCLLQPK